MEAEWLLSHQEDVNTRQLTDFIDDHFVLDKDSKSHEFLQWDMKVLIVRQYLERIKEDGNNSMLVKLKSGELPWNTPYGYKHVKLVDGKHTITIDAEKSHIVREIFRHYATGTCSILVARYGN